MGTCRSGINETFPLRCCRAMWRCFVDIRTSFRSIAIRFGVQKIAQLISMMQKVSNQKTKLSLSSYVKFIMTFYVWLMASIFCFFNLHRRECIQIYESLHPFIWCSCCLNEQILFLETLTWCHLHQDHPLS